jgi:peptidoglycan/LPS O-acetylase OafA/YrhL
MRFITGGWSKSIRQEVDNYTQSVTTSLEVSKSRNQIFALDGLRAIACLAVLSYHFNLLAHNSQLLPAMSGISSLLAIVLYFGESGVTLFFLLSGFLLFLPFAKAMLFDNPWPSIRRFYLRRIFRILPGYYAALLLIILFFHPAFLHPENWQTVWLFLTFSVDPTPAQLINGPFWTLAIEFQFYLLLPLIAWMCSLVVRHGSLRARTVRLAICLLALMAWGMATKYWGMYIVNSTATDAFIPHAFTLGLKAFIYGQTGKYFEVFAVGMLICMLYTITQNAPSAESWKNRLRRLSLPLFIAGLITLFFLSFWHYYYINLDIHAYKNTGHVFTIFDPYLRQFLNYWTQWQAFAYAISYGLCMSALLYGSQRLKWPFELSPLRWIGMISFSLYMWHLPLLFLFTEVILPNLRRGGFGYPMGYFVFGCWVLFIIFPLSLTFYRWIEMPGIRLGEFCISLLKKPTIQPSTTTETPAQPQPTTPQEESHTEVAAHAKDTHSPSLSKANKQLPTVR